MASPSIQAAILDFPQSPEARLRVALRQLDAALAEQREAIAAFRAQITSLGDAVSGLEGSAATLRESLSEAAAETERAQQAAGTLMATAEAMQRHL
jgi:chromosome segregation ATPase